MNPILLLVAGFDAISFGFWVALNALMPVWLQKPVKAGGFGFSILDNAACKVPREPTSYTHNHNREFWGYNAKTE